MRRGFFISALTVFFSIFPPSDSNAQHLYISPSPWDCSVDGADSWQLIDTYYIFLRAADVNDAVGASFRIESEAYGPEDFASVEPCGGVIIESGDLFSGIHLSFAAGQSEFDTLLTIHVELNEPHSYGVWDVAWTRDIQLYRASGDTLSLEDLLFYATHCHTNDTWIQWMHPDTVEATIGQTTTVDISCIGHSTGGLSWTNLEVYDQSGWFTGCSSCDVSVDCGPCPWDGQVVSVHITIPDGSPGGATDKLRIIPSGPCCIGDSTVLYIKAASTVEVEKSSWGKIKALFDHN